MIVEKEASSLKTAPRNSPRSIKIQRLPGNQVSHDLVRRHVISGLETETIDHIGQRDAVLAHNDMGT